MIRQAIALGLGAAGLCTLAACTDGSLALSYHDHRPVVYDDPHPVHVSHVCTRHCNHYWNGDRYITVTAGHRHGPGCGHVWDGRRWVIIAKAPARHHHGRRDVHIRGPRGGEIHVRHQHGPGCGCVFDRRGNKWRVIGKSHVHGPGCGHVYIEGRWSIRY